MRLYQRVAVWFMCVAMIPGASLAAVFTWDGGGGDDNLSTPANWNPNGAPATDGSAALLFVGAIRPNPINDFPALTPFTDLNFGTSATSFTLTGASVALSGGIDDATAATAQAINLNLALANANHTINVANTGTLNIGGAISGVGAGIVKTGNGTLVLSGANTYTGNTVVKNGSLVLDFANPASPTSQILYSGVGSGRNLTLGKDPSGEGGDNSTRAYSALVANGSSAGSATPVTQTFDSTTFGKGISRVEVYKGTDPGSTTTVDLGAITHTVGGTTFFLLPTKSAGSLSTTVGDPNILVTPALTLLSGTLRTSSTNSNGTVGANNGILGGWAYIADTLFGLRPGSAAGSFEIPANSGKLAATEFASVDAGGNIVPFTGYTTMGPINPTPLTNLKIVSNPNAVIDFKVVYADHQATAQFLANAVPNGQVTVLFAPGTDTSQIAIGQFFSGAGTFGNGGANSGLMWSTVAAIDSPTQIRLQPFSTGATSAAAGPNGWSVYAPGVQQLDMNTAGLTDVNSIRMQGATGRSIRIGTNNTLRLGKSGAIFYSNPSIQLTFNLIGTQAPLFPAFVGQGIQNDGTLTAGGPDVAGVAQPGELTIRATMPSEVSGGLGIATKITDNPGDDNDFSTGPNGAVTLVKSGSGSLSIQGFANTYSGGTYILEGRVQLTGSSTVQSAGGVGLGNPNGFGTGPVTILPGGQWFASGIGAGVNFTNNLFIAGTGTAGESMGAIRFGAGEYVSTITLIGDATLGGGNSTARIIGQITGNHNLFLGGGVIAHELVLANPNPNGTPGSNNYTGDTQMNSRLGGDGRGLYHLGANEQIPNGPGFGNLIMNNVSTNTSLTIFDLAGFNETVNGLISLNQAAKIVIENQQNGSLSTLTVGDADATATFNGTIRNNPGTGGATGQVALTKIGDGTQTLGGPDTYSGPTNVNDGLLLINGTHTSAGNYIVGPNGTLGGTGSITLLGGNSITVDGDIAPGASIESLDVAGPVIFNPTSALEIELDGGSGLIDLLSITGNLSIASGALVDFLVTGSPTAPQYIFGTYTGTLTGSFGSSSVPSGYSLVQGSGQLMLIQIPEPATLVLALLAGFGAVGLVRRMRRRTGVSGPSAPE